MPEVGLSRPVSIFMVVVLPQPLEPKKPNISPFLIVKLADLTAVKSPNVNVKSWAWIAISFDAVAGLTGWL